MHSEVPSAAAAPWQPCLTHPERHAWALPEEMLLVQGEIPLHMEQWQRAKPESAHPSPTHPTLAHTHTHTKKVRDVRPHCGSSVAKPTETKPQTSCQVPEHAEPLSEDFVMFDVCVSTQRVCA